jgi:hypothetical protein
MDSIYKTTIIVLLSLVALFTTTLIPYSLDKRQNVDDPASIKDDDTVIIYCRDTLQNVDVSGHLIIIGRLVAQNVDVKTVGQISFGHNGSLVVQDKLQVSGNIHVPKGQARIDATYVNFYLTSITTGKLDVNGTFINNGGFKGFGFTKNTDTLIIPPICLDTTDDTALLYATILYN